MDLKAWLALRRLRADMNLLMTIAVIGAMVVGQWFEAGTVAFLFAFSLLLESWSVGRARSAIRSLVNLTPPTARDICPHDGDIMEISDAHHGAIVDNIGSVLVVVSSATMAMVKER